MTDNGRPVALATRAQCSNSGLAFVCSPVGRNPLLTVMLCLRILAGMCRARLMSARSIVTFSKDRWRATRSTCDTRIPRVDVSINIMFCGAKPAHDHRFQTQGQAHRSRYTERRTWISAAYSGRQSALKATPRRPFFICDRNSKKTS